MPKFFAHLFVAKRLSNVLNVGDRSWEICIVVTFPVILGYQPILPTVTIGSVIAAPGSWFAKRNQGFGIRSCTRAKLTFHKPLVLATLPKILHQTNSQT